MRRAARLIMLTAAMVIALAPAAMATQPTGVGHADGRNGGASAPGPHCHENLKASANNHSAHGTILTGAIHQGHVETGLADNVFKAVPCPGV